MFIINVTIKLDFKYNNLHVYNTFNDYKLSSDIEWKHIFKFLKTF